MEEGENSKENGNLELFKLEKFTIKANHIHNRKKSFSLTLPSAKKCKLDRPQNYKEPLQHHKLISKAVQWSYSTICKQSHGTPVIEKKTMKTYIFTTHCMIYFQNTPFL